MNRKIRLLIADNHRLVADACKHMLEPEFDVLAIATDGRALVQAAVELKPDEVILEVFLPRLNGLDAADQIKQRLPKLKLVFATGNPDPELAAEAFRRGASGYVLKHSGADELMTAIRGVMRGESFLSSLITWETIESLLHPPKHKISEKRLTHREAEILQLLAEGETMKEVAETLTITPRTVAFHKYSMMARLGIETNAGLIQYAMRNRMSPAQEDWAITDFNRTRPIDELRRA